MATPATPAPPRRSRLAGPLLFIGSLLMALLAAELLVRRVAPHILSIPWQDQVGGVRAALPNVEGRLLEPGHFEISVRFNSQRFRSDVEYPIVAPPDRLRVAVLGDSFVFGWGAEGNQTFPSQLELLLREHGIDAEVINAGIPGQSMGEKALWYRQAVARFHPAVVLLTVLLDDVDAENGLQLFSRQADGEVAPIERGPGDDSRRLRKLLLATPGYRFLSERSQLFTLVKRAIYSASRHGTENRVIVNGAAEIEANQKAFVQDGLPMVNAEVRWFDREVRRNGGMLAVICLPVREDVYESADRWTAQMRWKSAAMNRSVEAECSRDRIPFLDLGPYVRRRARTTREPLYYEGGETHPNARGYNVFAAGAEEFLTRQPGLRQN